MSQVLVLSMSYGYCGNIPNGLHLSVISSHCYEHDLNSHDTYTNQVQNLVDFARKELHENLVNEYGLNNTIADYLQIISHSVVVINHQ